MIKGQILYAKNSGSVILFDEERDGVMYAHVKANGQDYESRSLAGILAKGYWNEVYISMDVDTVVKHGTHDQKTHGSWATGNNGLGIEEVIRLHKSSDPLKQKIYAAEQSIRLNPLAGGEKPKIESRQPGESSEDYDKRYKEYSKKFTAWAVNERAAIVTERGDRLLDGSPAGVRKYTEEIIKSDWFIESFGSGSSLPRLTVSVGNTVAAGRHILQVTTDGGGRVVASKNEISIDRQSVKDS